MLANIMNETEHPKHLFASPFEPERYQLEEEPLYRFEVHRRDFLRSLGGGLLVGMFAGLSTISKKAAAQDSTWTEEDRKAFEFNAGSNKDELGAWIHIAQDEQITLFCGKMEMGQGVRTSLAQAILEELKIPSEQLTLVLGDTDLCPRDQGTWGSWTTTRLDPKLRRIGATARRVLIDLAAKEWGINASNLHVEDGSVVNPDNGDTLSYGTLVQGQELNATVKDNIPVIPASDWKISGTSLAKTGAREMVTGKHTFSSDVHLDSLQYGRVLRPPFFEAKMESVDTSKAEAMSDVQVVKDNKFVGVVAKDPHLAAKALDSIEVTWSRQRNEDEPGNSQNQFKRIVQRPIDRNEWRSRAEIHRGSVTQGFSEARVLHRASYTLPYIAHAPLEPRAAVAHWEGNQLKVWSGTQSPFGNRRQLAKAFGIQESNIRVRVPDMGSGYGGKTTSETVIEAARLAKDAGVPVKVVWTREEEFKYAYFRPAAVVNARVGVDAQGLLCAWEQTSYNAGFSGLACPYSVPHEHARFQPTRADLRQGAYRAVGSTANYFARESAMDESAIAAGEDPLAFRLKNLNDERLKAVLNAAAERFDWGKNKPEGHGFGLAACLDKECYLATFVELSVDDQGTIQLHHIVNAFDCGSIINPDNTKNQVDGSVIMGIGGALWEEIEYSNDMIDNPRFSQYRVPRLEDMPPMETILLNQTTKPPIGAGQAGIVAIAPAIANAVFDACGERIRDLPIQTKLRARFRASLHH